MHAAVLWTINDFPAYGDLSGCVTKGYMACPVCNDQTCSQRLRNKLCFMRHRRNLSKDHPWRRSRKFNGRKEDGEPPRELSGDDVLLQLKRLPEQTPRKFCNKKIKGMAEELNWSRHSFFFFTSSTSEVHEELNSNNSDVDELDDTLVDYCSSEEDSQKNSVSDDESDDDYTTGQ